MTSAKITVFTNGCFDILHPGHVDLLERAKALGDHLVVGINSDRSVGMIKGAGRPFVPAADRRRVLLGLEAVDEVIIFDEATPEKLIERLKPDVLVKGGDWKPGEIVGAAFVRSYGGRVESLELVDGYSSSGVVDKIRDVGSAADAAPRRMSEANSSLLEHTDVFNRLALECSDAIGACAAMIVDTFKKGNKILICGNGGSAADAQHIAAEFVGRYETERTALPAVALTTDTSALTALANDYDFERIFSRQVEALANSGDLLIAISTSGRSPNVLAAVMAARSRGCRVLGMTGAAGKKLAVLSDACLMVPSERTARIQEAHICVAHIWCEAVDKAFANGGDGE